jgi:hypothetical protein
MATRMALVPDGWELPSRHPDDGPDHQDEPARAGVGLDVVELDVDGFGAADELDPDLDGAVLAGWA